MKLASDGLGVTQTLQARNFLPSGFSPRVKLRARSPRGALSRFTAASRGPPVLGITVNSVVAYGLTIGLFLIGAPAAAQTTVPADLLTDVCLPYAGRSQSFEKAISAARELAFRRPVGDSAPLDEWASEVTLVSWDGVWRLRIAETTVEYGERAVYEVSCTISSRRASARELADLGRRAFNNPAYWTSPPDNPWRWERRSARPNDYGLAVEVSEQPGERPTMTVRGSYY